MTSKLAARQRTQRQLTLKSASSFPSGGAPLQRGGCYYLVASGFKRSSGSLNIRRAGGWGRQRRVTVSRPILGTGARLNFFGNVR